MNLEIIGPEAEALLDWISLTDTIEVGHALPPAKVADSFLYRGEDTLLTRSAWIEGLGLAVKAATVMPTNPTKALPAVNGSVTLYDDETGRAEALIDFHLVTRWKTAGDSLLAARRLARPDVDSALIVGAGAVAESMVSAYRAVWPDLDIAIWNRSPDKARRLASRVDARHAEDLPEAVAAAGLIATCTMSTTPVIRGEWISPGTHLDLIGAYRSDMREVDDTALMRADLFVDSRATTIGHIGEIENPLRRGIITETDIRADFYDLPARTFTRRHMDAITICKNGGGAHLDLMTARYILAAWQGR